MTEDVKDNELQSQPDSSLKTPGAMLRHARREKKLSQEDVSKQLRLSVQWIKDLENNDYSRAAALIYVRGYLRSYARWVDLSPDDIMAAFEELGLEEAYLRDHSDIKVIKHQAVPIISKSTRIIVSRRALRWVSASAVVVLVVLVGIWWQGQKKHGSDHSSAVVMQQPKQELQIQTTAPTADSNVPATPNDKAATPEEEATPAQDTDTDAPAPDKDKVKPLKKNNKPMNFRSYRRKAADNNADLPAP